jgi:signal transduction histidine kinase
MEPHRLLIADDHPVERTILLRSLEKWGYDVVVCENGSQALDSLLSLNAPPIALLDWNMPGLDGIEVIQALRSRTSEHYIYCFLLTARDSKEDLIFGLEHGADDYLTKPYRSDELKTRIRAAQRIVDLEFNLKRQLQARMATEAQLAQLNAHLERRVAERTVEVEHLLQQKNAFINQLGHDLKTPLTPMLTLFPMIEAKLSEPATRQMASIIRNNMSYMRNLVEKTVSLMALDSSHIPLDLEPIDGHSFFSTLFSSFDAQAAEREVVFHNGLPEGFLFFGDQLLMREMFSNLIQNSLKYMGKAGTIGIDPCPMTPEDQDGLRFWDDGNGVDVAIRPRLFDEFFKGDQSRHDRGSTGLGLAICKKIIHKHGGEIELFQDSRGLEFKIYLPKATLKRKEPSRNESCRRIGD